MSETTKILIFPYRLRDLETVESFSQRKAERNGRVWNKTNFLRRVYRFRQTEKDNTEPVSKSTEKNSLDVAFMTSGGPFDEYGIVVPRPAPNRQA